MSGKESQNIRLMQTVALGILMPIDISLSAGSSSKIFYSGLCSLVFAGYDSQRKISTLLKTIGYRHCRLGIVEDGQLIHLREFAIDLLYVLKIVYTRRGSSRI